jgi:hypothetical protein
VRQHCCAKHTREKFGCPLFFFFVSIMIIHGKQVENEVHYEEENSRIKDKTFNKLV